MNEPDKLIDLPPNQWRSERIKPHEPFFGPGLPGAIAWIAGYALTATAVYFVLH
jgi:hypothetical protein